MNKLRILVADDHEIVRLGIVALIQSQADWEVCAECENGRQAVEKAKDLKPDIAILDIGMPQLNGLEATRQIVADNPRVKILILTINDTEQIVRVVLDAGARAFVLKSDVASDLISAVEALRYNRTFFASHVAEMILSNCRGKASSSKRGLQNLTSRERQVLQLVAEGRSTKQAASDLQMSPKTAETHRGQIMRKLGLHSVSELVLYAVRNNIIQVKPAIPSLSRGKAA